MTQNNKPLTTMTYLVKQYQRKLKRYTLLLRNLLNEQVILVLFLIILQGYLVSKCLLENDDNAIFNDPKYKSFMERQITNQHLIVEEYVRNCTDKQELTRLCDIIEELIEESRPAEVVNKVIMPDSEPIADWKSRVLLFVGLSCLIVVLGYYYNEIISSIVSIASSVTVVELQDHILNRLNVLMQLDSTKISEVFDTIND